MSIQDDIERYAPSLTEDGRVARIAAGLERDYYLVKLADLPEVTESGDGWITSVGVNFSPIQDTDALKLAIQRLVAVIQYREARESEAAVLARRRDELAQEFWKASHISGFDDIGTGMQDSVNRVIAEQDRAAAAEAEVARLEARS